MTSSESDLIDAYLDGNLTPEQGETLQQLLANDSEARARLRLRATITEFLTDQAITSKHPSVMEPKSAGLGGDETKRNGVPLRLQIALPWAIAASLALFVLSRGVSIPKRESTTTDDTFLGLIVDESEATFETGFAPENVKLHAGEYRLRSGAIHLRLENGTDILMESPADFQIVDPFHVTLVEGRLRAVVPPSARGFTVVAPGIDYVDLGTEFGIAVDEATGESQLHVFDGQVNATNPDSHALLSEVTEGESVAFSDGSLTSSVVDKDRFLTKGAIGFLRWQKQRELLEQDPDLLAFYPFIEADTLLNTAVSAVSTEGQIEGAPWVSGRWPGKSALLFDRITDFVELDLPGEYDALTFAAWIKLDRLGPHLNSIFNSNGLEEGDIHWDIASDGRMMLIRRFNKYRNLLDNEILVPTGRWIHVAGTMSTRTQEQNVYINGQLAGSDRIESEPLTPGRSRIGQWLSSSGVPKRELRGRIDELAIWNRALSKEEIEQLTEAGKPDAMWSAKLN